MTNSQALPHTLKCTCTLIGDSPISFGRAIQTPKGADEGADDHEERTWRERMHTDEAGVVFIPPTALKNCLADVAKYLSESIPGKGKATYTKHFEAGTMVMDAMSLNIKATDVVGERLFVPADGRRGGGKRVWRTFPTIQTPWTTQAIIYLFDPLLIAKPSKVEDYLGFAGRFIGLGRFRPRNNGFYGRFHVADFATAAA